MQLSVFPTATPQNRSQTASPPRWSIWSASTHPSWASPKSARSPLTPFRPSATRSRKACIPSHRFSGRKRLFRLIDIAAHLDRIYAACQAKVPQAKRRGRPTKAEQLRRQLQHHDNADTAALHGSQPDDAPAPSRTASGPGGSRQRGASSAAETAGRPSGRQRSGGAARPAEAQRGHPADRSTVQGESCGSATQQEASGRAEPADASQRSLRSRVAALCAAGPARKAADGASSPVNEDARPSGARRARPRGATDAQVASPPEPIPDFVPLIVTNENEVAYED